MSLTKTPSFAWHVLANCDPKQVEQFTANGINAGIKYKLGAKVSPLSSAIARISEVDCSGFVRWAIFQVCGTIIPDGSVNQHQWADIQGLKKSTVNDAKNKDNFLRIAFLRPQGDEPGHVMLIANGLTCESHGGKGIDRRPWGSCSWMGNCEVYVLALPVVGK